MSDKEGWNCPDGGYCHHNCAPDNCFRVGRASPLSGVYPDDRWPADLTFDREIHESYDVMQKLES